MTKLEKIILAVLLVGVSFFFLFWKGIPALNKNNTGASANKAESKKKEEKEGGRNAVQVAQKWSMPEALKEISGIVYLNDNRFACIQDELGTIFIYNTASGKIEQELPFGAKGDYEDIAVVEKTAYVVRADGVLFEVPMDKKSGAKQYTTHLTEKHDIEGLCYDQKQNRLLLAVKGKETDSKDYKGIYAFDLQSKSLGKEPVYKVQLDDPVFKKVKEKKADKKMQPSAIAVHPKTGELYITDGPDARLLIMDAEGKAQQLFQLDRSVFEQAEGITFSPEGELYISNEGRTGVGNIMKVNIEGLAE